MCGERDESITHFNPESQKLAQKEYKQRHDNIAKIVHLELCQKFALVGKFKWYNHKPASVVENDRVKILWDFNIQTDHVIQHRQPDIVVLYKLSVSVTLLILLCLGTKRLSWKNKKR